MRKRAEQIARTGNILMDSDAIWLVKYLASNREFCQSFDMYLKQPEVQKAVQLRMMDSNAAVRE
ncbi:unnamed protein product, partial [Anisakis simplex]|uniref:Nipped-B-like protein pqn-85 (inferred by orthology to a C. elegans protein) n=1 Tax=Anisakis simplex TaxID=6269 RepID=A0A0M3KKL9_ANISI